MPGWSGAEWAEMNTFTSFGKEYYRSIPTTLCLQYMLLLLSGSIEDARFYPSSNSRRGGMADNSVMRLYYYPTLPQIVNIPSVCAGICYSRHRKPRILDKLHGIILLFRYVLFRNYQATGWLSMFLDH